MEKSQKLNVKVIGIGEFGSKITRQIIQVNNADIQTIIVDWRSAVLMDSLSDKKIRIRKSSDCFEETIRIRNTVERSLADADIVFIVADMSEKIIRDYAGRIAHVAKESGILTLGIAILPVKTKNKHLYREAYNTLLSFRREIAVAAFRLGTNYLCDNDDYADGDMFDSIGNYDNMEYFCEVTMYSETKIKQQSMDFCNDDDVITPYNAAINTINKILKMMSANYVNSSLDCVMDVLRIPGGLHIASAHNEVIEHQYVCNWPPKRTYILARKLAESGLMNTSLFSTKSLLFHLIVPINIQNEEIKYLCEQIEGLSGAEHIELAIDVDSALGNTIKAEIIATDSKTNDEWEDYCEM